MSLRSGRNSIFLIPILLILILLLSGTALAQEPPPPGGRFPGARVDTSQETGRVTFIGAEAGQPLEVGKATASGLNAGGRADAVKEYVAPFFGVDNPKDLVKKRQHSQENRITTRYQQQYKGMPVMGGELVLNQTGDGRLMAASGEASPNLNLSVEAKVSKNDARKIALGVTAKNHQVEENTLKASEPELWIYDPQLLQPSEDPPELVWRLEVSSTAGEPINELVLVNAETSWVSLHFNQIDTSWSVERDRVTPAVNNSQLGVATRPTFVGGTSLRRTYDLDHGTTVPGGTLICDQDGDCSSVPDAVSADIYAEETYDYYWTNHNRDSIDDGGMIIDSYVRYSTGYCNAFWDGYEMVFGEGCSIVADDIVGHELTHGVTDYESNLYYWYESGAINEAFSDLWGEFVDQETPDAAGDKWYIGEDSGLGAFRNMANPPEFGDPDSMTSGKYYRGSGDNGGVHYNNGVNNKAVYLMTDGGSFNKFNINGIGKAKVAAIYYDVQTSYLTSGADYRDLYNAVYQSCLGLAGGSESIDLDDCTQVHKALLAVKMNEPPRQIAKDQAEVCPSGQQPADIFYEDFESGASGWSTHSEDDSGDWYLDDTYNEKRGSYAAWGPNYPITNYDPGYWNGVSWMLMDTGVTIPADQQVYVHFLHEFGFEFYGNYYWDGGQIWYSPDDGSNWYDAASLFDKKGQKYNGEILTYGGWNPWEGQNAFVADSGGWVSTRLDLSKDPSIAGNLFKFAFGIGTDFYYGAEGWEVDDFRIYTCTDGPPDMPTKLKPGDSATVVGTPQHSWKGNKKVDVAYQMQYADADYSIVYSSPEFTGTKYTPTYNLVGDFYWRVRAKGVMGDWSDWTPFLKLTVLRDAPGTPELVSPTNKSATNNTTPTFDWDVVSYDGGGYHLDVASDSKFSTIVAFDSTTSGITDVTPCGVLSEGTYYWRVRAQNLDGIWGNWSKVSQFTVDTTSPTAPLLSKPKDHSYSSKQLVSFAWKYTTKDSRNAYLSLTDCSAGIGTVFVIGNKYKMPSPLDYGRYCWYASAQDWAGNWSSSLSSTFTFDITLMKSPKPDSTIKGDIPTFKWKAHPDAKTGPSPRYEIMVDDDPNFGSPEAASGEVGNVTSFTWPASLSSGTWYWRIRFSPDGCPTWGSWMPGWAFVVP